MKTSAFEKLKLVLMIPKEFMVIVLIWFMKEMKSQVWFIRFISIILISIFQQ